MPRFSKRSEERLTTAHPDLQKLFRDVVKTHDCTILNGHRNEEKQNAYFEKGVSKVRWPNSRHNITPSEAVDVMPYPIDWDDMRGIREFAEVVKARAESLDIDVQWGGDWKNFFDGPHWQRRV